MTFPENDFIIYAADNDTCCGYCANKYELAEWFEAPDISKFISKVDKQFKRHHHAKLELKGRKYFVY